MAQYFQLHAENPQPRLVRQAASIIQQGGVIAYPTDSSYALGCHLDDPKAVARMRAIRQVDENHLFTLVCRNLSEIARFARVDNQQYRFLKAHTPGAFTFILEASREVPRRVAHPKRHTIGIRIPNHPVVTALTEALDAPLLSTTLQLPNDDRPLGEASDIRERLEKQLDLIVDAGSCGITPTTVVDLCGSAPEVIRVGLGILRTLDGNQ